MASEPSDEPCAPPIEDLVGPIAGFDAMVDESVGPIRPRW